MKKLMFITAIILMFLVNPTYAKTVAKATVNGYEIKVTYKNGKTKVKWNGWTIHTYRGKYKVKIISEKKLTSKKLIERKDKKVLYIEKVTGRVTNKHLDGKTSNGGYISYRCLGNKVRRGDKVVSFFVYNPTTRWIDDIDDRCDVPLKYHR